jgi:hypothetical protein
LIGSIPVSLVCCVYVCGYAEWVEGFLFFTMYRIGHSSGDTYTFQGSRGRETISRGLHLHILFNRPASAAEDRGRIKIYTEGGLRRKLWSTQSIKSCSLDLVDGSPPDSPPSQTRQGSSSIKIYGLPETPAPQQLREV